MTVADLPGGDFDLGAAPSLQCQAIRLGDQRLPVIQRQALGERIGQEPGNGHLQQVLAFMRQNQTLAGNAVQRD